MFNYSHIPEMPIQPEYDNANDVSGESCVVVWRMLCVCSILVTRHMDIHREECRQHSLRYIVDGLYQLQLCIIRYMQIIIEQWTRVVLPRNSDFHSISVDFYNHCFFIYCLWRDCDHNFEIANILTNEFQCWGVPGLNNFTSQGVQGGGSGGWSRSKLTW